MVRHDLEHFVGETSNVVSSAQYEFERGAKGDYYFCTGAITNAGVDTTTIVAKLRQAVSNYGASIFPHNGGLVNPKTVVCNLTNAEAYEYFHWGLDEAYDLSNGDAYASNSLAISFSQIETWVTNQPANPRVWVVPYFNGTRENTYKIQEQLNVKINGEQKLSPFPHWTLSTQTDGKRYAILSEPVSDWFVGPQVAQVVGPWQGSSPGNGQHDINTLHAAVDFYYDNGFLINFYSHSLTAALAGTSDDKGLAADLTADYVVYCTNRARIWPSNAREIYQWWLQRSNVQITISYSTNGTHSVATVAMSGSQNTNTAVEIFAPGSGSVVVFQLKTNGVAATTDSYRVNGELIKVRMGASVTNVQVEFFPGPLARNDIYTMIQGQALSKNAASGVLSNDWSGSWSNLTATLTSGPSYGNLTLTNNGGFTYTPTNNFWGTECFSYQAGDGINSFGTAIVTILVTKTNSLFTDDFRRCTDTALAPWLMQAEMWSLGNGLMQGVNLSDYANVYLTTSWTNYSVGADVSLANGTYGGGLGARLGTGGDHYVAWLYPGNSPGASNVLKLVKFNNWTQWGTGGTDNHIAPMETNVPPIGASWHPLKLTCSNNFLQVFYHGTNVISFSDSSAVYSTGSISLDQYAGSILVSNFVVTPIP